MTEPDKSNVRLITDAVASRLKKLHPPHPVALPEEDDSDWRDVLARIERSFQAMKDEEAER